jgi:hypothetical protein
VVDVLNIPGEFGRQTVGFVTVTDSGTPGYLGVVEQARAVTTMSGVRFRPLNTEEAAGLTSELKGLTTIADEVWKLTAPAAAASLAAQSTGEIVYDGTANPMWDDDDNSNVFQVEGFNQPKPGMYGGVHHVTILCSRQRS